MTCPDYNQVSSFSDITEVSGLTEPVTVSECKDYMRLEGWSGEESEATEFSFDDDLIADLRTSARQFIEQEASVSLMPHLYEVVLTNMGGIELPFSPIDEVTTVLDSNGDEADADLIKVRGNDRKYLITPTGWNLTVTYTTKVLLDSRPLHDIKILVWAMYNAHTKDPQSVMDKISLWLNSYSRKSVIA